ncbi:hypothetical protein Tco_0806878 [Tanacetum coccineum]
MGGSYYLFPCSIFSTKKDRKTPQRYPDVPKTSWRISIRIIDSFQGLTPKSPSSWNRPLALKDLALYDNESWNDPRDFGKLVKAIALPQDVPNTFDRHLIELENQVQRLMEAYLALTQPTQVNKITTLCEICSGPHDTQYFMEDPEQAFVEYASLRTDEAGGKWYTFKSEQNNFGDTYNSSWKSHPNLRWRQPQNSLNNFSNPPNLFQPNSFIPNHSFNNNPRSLNNQSNLEGLVSNFMASQDARLSKFEADFKQQQSEMTNKIDIVLKAITDRITGALPSDTVKNPKLSTSPVLPARSYPNMDPQCSNHIHGSINAVTIHPEQQSDSYDDKAKENEEEEKDSPENIHANPSTPPDPSGDDAEVMFIEIIRKNDDSHKEGPEEEGSTTTEGVGVEYFDIFPTRSQLAYHKYLMCGLISSIFLRNPIITEGCPLNLKIPCNIRNVHVEKAYIDPNSPLNIMTRMMYNRIMRRKLNPRENSNRGVSNFTRRIKGMHVFIGNFTYVIDFMIIEDISSIIDLRLSQVVLGRPFVEISNMTIEPPEEKEHTKSVYLRNEEDKRRGAEYVMSKILRFYKECLELEPEYLTGMDGEGEVTLYLMRRSLEVLRKFHWIIIGGRFNHTWMAFRGKTSDLGSFGEETDEITDLHQILEEVLLTERGDGVTGIKRHRRDPSSDGVKDLVTALGRGRLNEDLDSST